MKNRLVKTSINNTSFEKRDQRRNVLRKLKCYPALLYCFRYKRKELSIFYWGVESFVSFVGWSSKHEAFQVSSISLSLRRARGSCPIANQTDRKNNAMLFLLCCVDTDAGISSLRPNNRYDMNVLGCDSMQHFILHFEY